MRPFNNSPLVDRLQSAHGVVLGKTRMHELAFGGSTIAPGYHTTLNPYNNLAHAGGTLPCSPCIIPNGTNMHLWHLSCTHGRGTGRLWAQSDWRIWNWQMPLFLMSR